MKLQLSMIPLAAAFAAMGCTGASKSTQPISATGPLNTSPPVDHAIPASAGVEDLVAAALRHSSEIRAGEARVRRLLAKVPQARTLPDPKARMSLGSLPETAAGRVDAMVSIEQGFPFPGKLREMAAAAGKEAEAAVADLEGTRQEVAEQVRASYWDYYLASQTGAITKENGEALKLVRDSVDALVAADKATQNDQLRLAAEFGKVEKALVEADATESRAKARLNATLNRPAGSSLPPARQDGSGTAGELSKLLARAENEHPSVLAAKAELSAFEHRLKRADLEKYPDFSVGIQHAFVSDDGLAPSANGRDQTFATFGVSIPLWQGARRAMVEEARAGMEEAAAKIGAARSSLRHRVEDAWFRARAADKLINLFEKQILPEAKQAFDIVLAGYAAGTQSFVDVLDVWRNLLAFQLQQAGNRAAYGKAIAALRSAVGEELPKDKRP